LQGDNAVAAIKGVLPGTRLVRDQARHLEKVTYGGHSGGFL
jgi:hypothetical protein